MKIYHTETQADYDALLIHLKELGYKYIYGSEFSEERPYVIVWWTDMVMRSYQELMEDEEFKSLPITKYKAKVNEMKFTKENVFGLFGEYRINKNGIQRLDDLEKAIMDLDDTPEKVVVPKFVAEWLEDKRSRIPEFHFESGARFIMIIGDALHKMNYESVPEDVSNWIFDERNDRTLCNAIDYGYEVEKEPFSWAVKGITDYFKCDGKIIVFKNEEEALEVANLIGINTEVEKMNNIDCQDCISIEELRNEKKEQLYYVALPKLDDADFRYLWTDVDGAVYTQNRKGLCIGKLKHTESEIKAIDERYWPFAVPAND